MKFNQALSWKFVLPIGIVLWLVGKFVFPEENIIGSALALLGFIMAIFGIIDLVRSYSKRKKEKEN